MDDRIFGVRYPYGRDGSCGVTIIRTKENILSPKGELAGLGINVINSQVEEIFVEVNHLGINKSLV